MFQYLRNIRRFRSGFEELWRLKFREDFWKVLVIADIYVWKQLTDFENYMTYDSEQTRVLLTSASFVHLTNADFAKHTRNLSPASRTILLSGPAG